MNPEKFANQPPQENSPIEVSIKPEQGAELAEAPKVLETVADPKILEEYQKNNSALQNEIARTEQGRDLLAGQIRAVRENLYGENIPPAVSAPSVDEMNARLEELRLEQIKASSNYPGDWTLLLRDRMLDPITKEKFIRTRQESMLEMQTGEIGDFDKPKRFASHYENQITEYDSNLERIFGSTNIGNATEHNKNPHNLGVSNIGEVGTVFDDASHENGELLNVRQKNIIEAHEKGHGIRDFTSTDKLDFKDAIDLDIVEKNDLETGTRQISYLSKAEEIAERMAQLKNYFGMTAADTFTKDHLKYAAEHYVADVGLDNNMNLFLKAVTGKTVDKFIDTINKYPL